MSGDSVAYLIVAGSLLKQALAIGAALASIYFGYRLFYLTEAQSGQFEAKIAGYRVRLEKVAPGVFFTLFGCGVLVAALFQNPEYHAKVDTPISKTGGVGGKATEMQIAVSGLATGDLGVDPVTCARSINYATDKLRTIPAAAIGSPEQRNEEVDQLNLLLARCVDRAAQPGDFKKYRNVVQADAEGRGGDVSKNDRAAYNRVLTVVSD